MNSSFTRLFTVPADEIVRGDYLYFMPWLEERKRTVAQLLKKDYAAMEREKEEQWLGSNQYAGAFMNHWLRRTIQNTEATDADIPMLKYFIQEENLPFSDIICAIARENKPFLDIACGEGMGLAPYILHENPQIPCLMADIDDHLIRCLRKFKDEHLSDYNISFASFNNGDIPFADNSISCITSYVGLGAMISTPLKEKLPPDYCYQFAARADKVIDEVYRILAHGGYMVVLETDYFCEYDETILEEYYRIHEKAFGIYTHEEMMRILFSMKHVTWEEQFRKAGFTIETHAERRSTATEFVLKNTLYTYSRFNELHNWTEEEIASWRNYNLPADIGIHLYNTESFFLLRKE